MNIADDLSSYAMEQLHMRNVVNLTTSVRAHWLGADNELSIGSRVA